MKIDKNTRDRFKDHPYFGACEGENCEENIYASNQNILYKKQVYYM